MFSSIQYLAFKDASHSPVWTTIEEWVTTFFVPLWIVRTFLLPKENGHREQVNERKGWQVNGWENHNELWLALNHYQFWGQYEKLSKKKRKWQSNLFVYCIMLLHLSRSRFFNFFSILFLLIYRSFHQCFDYRYLCNVFAKMLCDVLHQRVWCVTWKGSLEAAAFSCAAVPGLVWWHHPPPPLS